jgi:hypothetical protein
MNGNQEKMIEVYKKQLNSLQNRLNQVSKERIGRKKQEIR